MPKDFAIIVWPDGSFMHEGDEELEELLLKGFSDDVYRVEFNNETEFEQWLEENG